MRPAAVPMQEQFGAYSLEALVDSGRLGELQSNLFAGATEAVATAIALLSVPVVTLGVVGALLIFLLFCCYPSSDPDVRRSIVEELEAGEHDRRSRQAPSEPLAHGLYSARTDILVRERYRLHDEA